MKYSRLKYFWLLSLLCLWNGSCCASPPPKAPKTLIVTCASGELGSAAARILARDYNLLLTGRNLSKLQQLQKELMADNPWQYETCTSIMQTARLSLFLRII